MNARHVFVAGLTVFAVVAAAVCARRNDQGRIEFARQESNRLIAEVEEGKRDLNARYGLTLLPLIETVPPAVRAQEFDWSRFSAEERRAILMRLFRHVANVERIFLLGSQEGVHLEGGTDQLSRSRDIAWLFYLSGKKFEGRIAARLRRMALAETSDRK